MATYTPVNSDATAVAQRTIDRLATVTGIAGLQNPVDLNTTTGGQLVAIADSYLNAIGYQARPTPSASTGGNVVGQTSFGSVPGFASASISVLVARIYVVHVDICNLFCSALAGGNDYVQFQLTVGASTASDASTKVFFETVNIRKGISFRIPMAFAAGSNTVSLQCKCTSVGTTINTDTNTGYCFTVTA